MGPVRLVRSGLSEPVGISVRRSVQLSKAAAAGGLRVRRKSPQADSVADRRRRAAARSTERRRVSASNVGLDQSKSNISGRRRGQRLTGGRLRFQRRRHVEGERATRSLHLGEHGKLLDRPGHDLSLRRAPGGLCIAPRTRRLMNTWHNAASPKSTPPKSTLRIDRLKSFSDGVLTVVITLMVFGIDIPTDHHFTEEGLVSFLQKIGFQIMLYIISFWLVATYWAQHYVIFQNVRVGDRTLFWLNLLFLLPVTLIPAATKLKGLYPLDTASIIVFGILQIICGLCLLGLWLYVSRRPALLVKPVTAEKRKRTLIRFAISPVLMSLLAILVSFWRVRAGTLMFLGIPLFLLMYQAVDAEMSHDDPA
ncbi:MAG: hypothetical protein C0483_19215 [Pirellula sp.]|nr:hypothetical protein [Pirellula sp.]